MYFLTNSYSDLQLRWVCENWKLTYSEICWFISVLRIPIGCFLSKL